MTKIYYGPNNTKTDQYRLSPAPQITISTQPSYNGDVIVGYIHTVSLKGYATGYRKLNNQEPSHSVTGIGLVTDNISIVKKILSYNGGSLSVNEDDGTEVMRCKGGTIRSLSFNESPNNWMGSAEYNAQIEFNEVELLNGTSLNTISCSESYIDSNSLSSSVVDTTKHKIKNFGDSWSITIDDAIYSRILQTDYQNMETDNSSMTVSYNISATGKNYYVDNKLIPAWEQAKNFAQDKLFNKINNLLTSALGLTANTACAATSSVSGVGASTNGALSNLSGYGVYNETLSCSTSESDGTFSLTYNAIIKKNNNSATNHPASRHTFSKNVTVQNDTKRVTTISVQGTIEGLVTGGVIRAIGSGFKLPNNGSILISTNISEKYSNALTALNKIVSGADLTSLVKTRLGISLSSLGITSEQLAQCGGSLTDSVLIPSSFSLTHNYHEGIINYNVEYSSDIICGQVGALSSISISVEDPTPILAELPIPHSDVLVIQDMNTVTNKRVSISIEGRLAERECCLNQTSLASRIGNATFSVPSGITLPDMSNYILTQQQRTDNIINGSYTISLGYICSSGCE